jgi:hypothetical protein
MAHELATLERSGEMAKFHARRPERAVDLDTEYLAGRDLHGRMLGPADAPSPGWLPA